MSKFATLEDILKTDNDKLAELTQGEFKVKKIGFVPFLALEHKEHKQAKRDCTKMVKDPSGTGGMMPDIDDDALMLKIIVMAVDKDSRSTFTFSNSELLKKLGVISAESAVQKLLSPGEIYNMAVAIQNASGFGAVAQEEAKETVKNS